MKENEVHLIGIIRPRKKDSETLDVTQFKNGGCGIHAFLKVSEIIKTNEGEREKTISIPLNIYSNKIITPELIRSIVPGTRIRTVGRIVYKSFKRQTGEVVSQMEVDAFVLEILQNPQPQYGPQGMMQPQYTQSVQQGLQPIQQQYQQQTAPQYIQPNMQPQYNQPVQQNMHPVQQQYQQQAAPQYIQPNMQPQYNQPVQQPHNTSPNATPAAPQYPSMPAQAPMGMQFMQNFPKNEALEDMPDFL